MAVSSILRFQIFLSEFTLINKSGFLDLNLATTCYNKDLKDRVYASTNKTSLPYSYKFYFFVFVRKTLTLIFWWSEQNARTTHNRKPTVVCTILGIRNATEPEFQFYFKQRNYFRAPTVCTKKTLGKTKSEGQKKEESEEKTQTNTVVDIKKPIILINSWWI